MKKPKPHRINEKGERLLEDLLPDTWVVNKQFRDYGKDFLVELADDDGELTGESFLVQLKSCKAFTLTCECTKASFALESRHARHYAKIKDLPVFLVLMDVTKEVGVFIFLQDWLVGNTAYLNKKSTTVPVPMVNRITDSQALTKEMFRAKEWLRARYPASLQNSAAAEVSRLKALDPRFDVRTRIESGCIHHELLANTNVQATFRTREGRIEAADKLRQFIEFGETVNFEPGEFNIDGSALLQQAELEGCQLSRNPVDAKLKIVGDEGGKPISLVFDGRLSGGERLLRIETFEAKSPLSIQLEIREQQVGLQLSFNAQKWEGLRVSQLPFFKICQNLLENLQSPRNLEFVIEQHGNELVKIPCPTQFDSKIESICQFISDLERVRRLCAHYRVDPTWSMKEFCREYYFFCQVEAITTQGHWSGRSVFSEITGVLPAGKAISNVQQLRKKPGPFTITSQTDFNFLGVQIPLGRVAKDFTHMRLKKCRKLKNKDEYEVQFVATQDTWLTMRRAEET